MKSLLLELIPHAPHLGLYTAPEIPAGKVANALRDYAPRVHADEVVALYDATLLGNAKDGAVFTRDRVVFQNTDLEPAQEVRYRDIVRVHARRKLLGGRRVELDVNRARATVTLSVDFSGKPKAAEYVARFLHEAMLRGSTEDAPAAQAAERSTDVPAVEAALDRLAQAGKLSRDDHERLLRTLRAG